LKNGVSSGSAIADRLPLLQLVMESANADSQREAHDGQSAIADSTGASAGAPAHGLNRDDLAQGLRRLGVPLGRSRQLIDAAIAALPRAEATEEEVLRQAIRSI